MHWLGFKQSLQSTFPVHQSMEIGVYIQLALMPLEGHADSSASGGAVCQTGMDSSP